MLYGLQLLGVVLGLLVGLLLNQYHPAPALAAGLIG